MREYVKPTMEGELFAANEYVAACHDINMVYKFKCDAGGGTWGSVYLETNGEEGLQTGWNGDTRISTYRDIMGYPISGYHACGEEHSASVTDYFLNGYYCAKGKTNNPVEVIVWRGPHNDNTHCTENLDMDSWETDRS